MCLAPKKGPLLRAFFASPMSDVTIFVAQSFKPGLPFIVANKYREIVILGYRPLPHLLKNQVRCLIR